MQLGELNATRRCPPLSPAAFASESKNGKCGLNFKVAVGAPWHSNLVPHQQKCCCVISEGRAFHRPTSHPPASMGTSRTRKTVGLDLSSNLKPLSPLVQNQSTPHRIQAHGRAQLSSAVLFMWLVWCNAGAVCLSWRCIWPRPAPPDVGFTRWPRGRAPVELYSAMRLIKGVQ